MNCKMRDARVFREHAPQAAGKPRAIMRDGVRAQHVRAHTNRLPS
jgi:hypothetical protein